MKTVSNTKIDEVICYFYKPNKLFIKITFFIYLNFVFTLNVITFSVIIMNLHTLQFKIILEYGHVPQKGTLLLHSFLGSFTSSYHMVHV